MWTSAPGFANELLLARGTVGAGTSPGLIGNVNPFGWSGGGCGCGAGAVFPRQRRRRVVLISEPGEVRLDR